VSSNNVDVVWRQQQKSPPPLVTFFTPHEFASMTIKGHNSFYTHITWGKLSVGIPECSRFIACILSFSFGKVTLFWVFYPVGMHPTTQKRYGYFLLFGSRQIWQGGTFPAIKINGERLTVFSLIVGRLYYAGVHTDWHDGVMTKICPKLIKYKKKWQ